MKTAFKYSYLLFLILPFFLSQCGNTSNDPQTVQTVTITDMWASSPIDQDGDGFISSFILNFDLDINTGVERGFVLLAIRFYDVNDTATYFELFSTNDFDIEKEAGPWEMVVDLPTNDYPPAGYDFLFLVLDSDNPDRRLAESSATDRELLSNVPLEHLDDDLMIVIEDLWISDSTDVDDDGYMSAFRLNFNLDSPGGTKDVYALLAARYHDPADTAAYTPYLITEDLTITGTEFDLRFFNIENTVPDFLQDSYDFLFIVYDAIERNVRLAEASATDNSDLRDVMLEPTDTENEIFIFDASFLNPVDYDGDGYHSEYTLEIDIDEINGAGEDVYVEIFYRPVGTTTYNSVGTTNVFTVNGELYDPIFININQHQVFAHGIYDFRVELKFSGYEITEDWTDASINMELAAVKLELLSEDQQITVDDAWQSSEFDFDSDGYNYWVVMSINLGISGGEADILVRPGYKLSNESTYKFVTFTDTLYLESGSLTKEDYLYQNFDRGIYDIAFELSFLGAETVYMTLDKNVDPDLGGIQLESWEEDGSP